MGKFKSVDTNLQGQKLGKKGRETRDRILATARQLIEDPESEGFSLSAVARSAGIRMSSIYNYFSDVTELFLAVLEPVADEAEGAYVALLRDKWSDHEIERKSAEFTNAFHDYWRRNSRFLHLRNNMADSYDERVLLQRIAMARETVRLLGRQMGGARDSVTGPEFDLASVLYTGLERVVTISTDAELKAHYPDDIKPRFEGGTLHQQARLLALAIKDQRSQSFASHAA